MGMCLFMVVRRHVLTGCYLVYLLYCVLDSLAAHD
jgi:hypothetical protein